jgi:predicted nuclease of predicted toxin-antitoxin system
MKILADEGVDKPIVDRLRSSGFDVKYVLEFSPAIDDEAILSQADNEKRILLTQDKDFGELVYRMKFAHYGVILIRLHGYIPQMKAKIVTEVLLQYQEQLQKTFTVIQPNGIRIRKEAL